MPSEPNDKATLFSTIKNNYQKTLNNIPQKDPTYKSYFEGRHEFVVNSIDNGHFLFDQETQEYYENILEEIFNSNPNLPKEEIHLFQGRYPTPNASSLGDGNLILNIGLMAQLENESQLAFILCHEIAHYYLKHAESSIEKFVKTKDSKENEKKLKRISKMEYGANAKAMELLEGIVYDHRRMSRKHENEADSIGLLFLKNTKYDARQSLKCMAILDSIDQKQFMDTLILSKYFDSVNYPYKDRWGKKEETFTFGQPAVEEDLFNLDSIRTHPDCKARIVSMGRQLSNYNATGKNVFLQPKNLFTKNVRSANFEIVQGHYYFYETAWSLYQALHFLEKFPDEPFLHAKVGLCLSSVYNALVEHDMDKQVELPSPYQHVTFRQLVQFLHNLRSKEVANIGYHYLNDRKDKYIGNEDFLFALILASDILELETEKNNYLEKYKKMFSQGRYLEEINSL